MKAPDIVIAVDGRSSTGKSTFAKLLAREFGFIHLDSGAVYRAVTLFARNNGLVSPSGEVSAGLEKSLDGLEIGFGTDGSTIMEGRSVEKEIRSMEISSLVSTLAAIPFVRAFVDRRLHELASRGRVVMDGRDIGTTVFPDAQLKIFLTASEEVRAGRRYEELKAKGGTETFEEVIANLRERDYIDMHRETSPLVRAADAFELDNSGMTLGEETAWARGLLQGRFGIL